MLVAGSPFTVEQHLRADEPWADVVEGIGAGHRIRGMFISPIAALLPEAQKSAVLHSLSEPPRGGMFVPFLSYSRRDYLRIVLAAAAVGDTDLSVAERVRRIARDDFETFSASVLGKTVRAAVGSARAALLKTPQVYAAVAPADDGDVGGGAFDDGSVELVFRSYPILWPYHLGQIEGMAMSFGERSAVDVDRDAGVVRYRVRLS